MQDIVAKLDEANQKKINRLTLTTYCIAFTWTLANVITEVFTIDEIIEEFFNAKKTEGINTNNIISGVLSLISNISMAFALIYYTKRQALEKINLEILNCSPIVDQHSHSNHNHELCEHSHAHREHDTCEHHHSCSEKLQHIVVHWVALWLPSFCLSSAAAFAAFSGQELEDIDEQHYLKTIPWGLTVAVFGTLGDATLHRTFLEKGECEHGTFLRSFHDIMIQKPSKLYKDNQCKTAVFAAWVTWGTLFAHISELTFSIDKGLNILIEKPCEYLFNYTIPRSIITVSVLTLAILGASLHSHSENRAWFQLHQSNTINKLKCNNLTQEYNWCLKSLFLVTAVANSIWHTAPEIPGLPEEIIFPYSKTLTTQLISFIGIILTLGIPDFITNFSLTAQAVEMLDKPKPNSPLLASVPPTHSVSSHLDLDATLATGAAFP